MSENDFARLVLRDHIRAAMRKLSVVLRAENEQKSDRKNPRLPVELAGVIGVLSRALEEVDKL